jgi:hypothetical protein
VISIRLSALALACLVVAPVALAADGVDLTVYRSDSDELFTSQGDGSVNAGYAVVHERRTLTLTGGTQDLVIGGLPAYLDAEAVSLRFPGSATKLLSQRLLLGQGVNGALNGLIGQHVSVLGNGGQPLADGTLLRAGDSLAIREGSGVTVLIRDYAAVRIAGNAPATGSTLQVRVEGGKGDADATLSYPTSGIGWRAAYVATLAPGGGCKLSFESRASIANRSGRDWNAAKLKLVAGQPNIAKASAPRPMMRSYAESAPAPMAPGAMPQQSTLEDLRTYTLPAAIDLPDGSVTQTTLYATRDISCERTALYENGNIWMPPQPMTQPGDMSAGNNQIVGTVRLRAFDSLPAGYARVLIADRDGNAELLGEGRLDDTPKDTDATIVLGPTFDLRGTRERTSFHLDKAGRTMDEAYRITLRNAGDQTRTITVREHPSRWREWKLASSSGKASKQTPDTLEFKIDVPAHGKATLDYAVRYSWSASDEQS